MHLHHFQYEEGSNPEDADSSLGGHFPSPAETVQNPRRIPIRHKYFCGWVGWTVFRGVPGPLAVMPGLSPFCDRTLGLTRLHCFTAPVLVAAVQVT